MGDRREPFTEDYVARVVESLDLPDETPRDIVLCPGHSNELAEVRFEDGRVLMVKRARFPEMAARFETDRAAARLLHEGTELVAPRYLPVAAEEAEAPILAYWRISCPTLEDLWPGLADDDRVTALRNWGVLVRHIHRVGLPSHGPLLEARRGNRSLPGFLDADLKARLRPAVREAWPAGAPVLDRLIETVPAMPASARQAPAVLVHNDLFAANLLCEEDDAQVRCVGVLDLEDAFSGPAEADLARTEILHGPLFGQAWSGRWFERILEGYGMPPNRFLIGLFRAYHLINMGLHAAATGLAAHAETVARAAARETAAVGSGRRHRDVLAGGVGAGPAEGRA